MQYLQFKWKTRKVCKWLLFSIWWPRRIFSLVHIMHRFAMLVCTPRVISSIPVEWLSSRSGNIKTSETLLTSVSITITIHFLMWPLQTWVWVIKVWYYIFQTLKINNMKTAINGNDFATNACLKCVNLLQALHSMWPKKVVHQISFKILCLTRVK